MSGRRLRALFSVVVALSAVLGGTLTGRVQHVAAAAPAGPTPILVDIQSDAPLGGLTTSPVPLTPPFSAGTTDYVLRCSPGTNQIRLTASPTFGHSLTHFGVTESSVVDDVNLVEGQAVVVQRSNLQDVKQEQYWIRCLPHDFPPITVSKPGSPAAGWYLTGTLANPPGSGAPDAPYAMILDTDGTPVWYAPASPGGALVVEPGLPVSNTQQATVAYSPIPANFRILALNGDPSVTTPVSAQQTTFNPTGTTDVHELLLQTTQGVALTNNDRVVLSYPLTHNIDLSQDTVPGAPASCASVGCTSETIQDCDIQEISSDGTNTVVWEWLASQHVAPTESRHVQGNNTGWDIYHCNSVDEDGSGNALVSMRHTDAVYDIDRTTKTVVWKLGGNSTTHDTGEQAVTIQGDSGPSGQHDARFQPSGQISLFDDETFVPGGVARGVLYNLVQDATTKAWTATRAAQFPNPLGKFTGFTGSFRPYADGSNLVGWGGMAGDSGFTDFTNNGSIQLDFQFPVHNGFNNYTYRTIKVPPATFDINTLRKTAGQNLQPDPVLQTDLPITALSEDASSPTTSISNQALALVTDADSQGRASQFSATIDWGDGSKSNATVVSNGQGPPPFSVTGSHTYAAPGTYLASVSIVDGGGSTASVVSDVFAGRSRALAVSGVDQSMWQRGPAPGGWQWFGGVLTGAPAVVALPQPGGGTVPLSIVVGSDHALWATVDQNSWYPFSTTYAYCLDTPGATVTSNGSTNTVVVACEGSDKALWVASTPLPAQGLPQVSGFTSLGGVLTAGPALLPDGSGGFAAFVEGLDRVYSWTAATNGFTPTPWQCIGRPSAALASDLVSYFACRGTDDALWVATNIDFTAWGFARSAGGVLRGPAGISAFAGDALVSVQGTDSAIWETTVTSDERTAPFHFLGGSVTDGAGAVATSG